MFCLDMFTFWYLMLKNEGRKEVCPQPCFVKNPQTDRPGESKSNEKRQAHHNP